jgi:hypothetical protein
MILLYSIISFFIAFSIPFVWILRNYNLTNEFPVMSVGGAHFMWYSHNKHILKIIQRGESADLIGVDERYPLEKNIRVSDFFRASPIEQVKLAEFCSKSVKLWTSNNKYEVFKYSLYKIRRFLIWEYAPREGDFSLHNIRVLVYTITNAPIVILGWFGIVIILLKRNKYSWFIAAASVGFVAIHVMSIGGSRHKIPLDALFCALLPFSIYYLYNTVLNLRKANRLVCVAPESQQHEENDLR